MTNTATQLITNKDRYWECPCGYSYNFSCQLSCRCCGKAKPEPSPITVEFCVWLQNHFDELVGAA